MSGGRGQPLPTWMSYRADCIPYETGCRQCGKGISFYRAYCSVVCHDTFEANHFWLSAASAALKASKVGGGWHEKPRCRRCGKECGSQDRWRANDGCGQREAEVNHIKPVNGQRTTFSCAHHQNNLETLCHDCHIKTTVEQRKDGLIGRRAA